MADSSNEAGRHASRAGNHALAEKHFQESVNKHDNRHSAANVVYERFCQGKATEQDVENAVYYNNLQSGGHGQWLLRQVGAEDDDYEEDDSYDD